MPEVSNEALGVKIDNLFVVQVNNHNETREQINEIKKAAEEQRKEAKEEREKFERRIRDLEDFRLKFVAKFSVYSAIALFVGSFAAQFFLKFIGK